MQITALTAALGLTGVAIAQNTEGATSPLDRGTIAGPETDTPSSGAIVTPQDKALGMGKDDARAGNGGSEMSDDASRSKDDGSIINPGQSHDEGSTVTPAPSNDDDSISPRRTGSDARPGDREPRSARRVR